MDKTTKASAACGVLFAALLFVHGYIVRGSHVAYDARLKSIQSMSDRLKEISDKLPEQKIVEKEKIVQSPFCDFALEEKISKSIRDTLPDFPVKDLQVCNVLMDFKHPLKNGSSTYDAIGEWIQTSKADPDSLEDQIMSKVLTTLIYCFQNT